MKTGLSPYTPMSREHREVLGALLFHASEHPTGIDGPNQLSGAIEHWRRWLREDPAREAAFNSLVHRFAKSLGTCMHADATAHERLGRHGKAGAGAGILAQLAVNSSLQVWIVDSEPTQQDLQLADD